MPKPRPLSVAQGLILNTAGRRSDRMVLPFPAGLPARGANQQRLVASLLKRGLVEEVTTALPTLSWRQDEQGGLHALLITTAGLAAVGIEADPPLAAAPHAGPMPVADTETSIPDAPAATPAVRPAGKLGRVMDAARAEQGAMTFPRNGGHRLRPTRPRRVVPCKWVRRSRLPSAGAGDCRRLR